MNKLTALFYVIASLTAAAHARAEEANDPNLWLEPARDPQALDWVKKQNAATSDALTKEAVYITLKDEMNQASRIQHQLQTISLKGANVSALSGDGWKQANLESYAAGNPQWESLLDLNALATAEGKKWTLAAVDCLPAVQADCLVSFSEEGEDAVEVREYDARSKSWVAGGFMVPRSKSSVSWIDQDHVYVSADFGPGSLSAAGYPLVTKLWARGTPLSSAVEVARGEASDDRASVSREGAYTVEARTLDRYHEEISVLVGEKFVVVPMPTSAQYQGLFADHLLFLLRQPLPNLPVGSLVSLSISALGDANPLSRLESVFLPTDTAFLTAVSIARGAALLEVMDNVRGKLYLAKLVQDRWHLENVAIPGLGTASVLNSATSEDRAVITYGDFLTPKAQYLLDTSAASPSLKLIRQEQKVFAPEPYETEQWFATSKDGTKVPYFIIHRKDMAFDGSTPTLQYGYGGFERSMQPNYMGYVGKIWLDHGGAYVMANIRGGGEFGPAWHEAAVGLNRQKAFDDFIAISEDLIARKVTNPRKLAIQGGSNGGLLVGAVFVQRPELYQAVLCEIPLLDMLRYPLIDAGYLWVGEYGDPKEQRYRDALLAYSPYQNLQPGKHYPAVFFQTNTSDDRVGPAHARKMKARMDSMGYPAYFFEAGAGGHGNSLEAIILEYTFLWQQMK